jgi:hypothetical protein
MKVSELTGAALDWAVAKAEGIELSNGCYNRLLVDGRMSAGQKMLTPYNPSTDWSQGGPIIEREKIGLSYDYENDEWEACKWINPDKHMPLMNSGPTPLIAAMRCYVASKLGGDEVEVPEELTQGEQNA